MGLDSLLLVWLVFVVLACYEVFEGFKVLVQIHHIFQWVIFLRTLLSSLTPVTLLVDHILF